MKVTLIEHTPNAKELLIFSKKTRLMNDVHDYEKIKKMTAAEKATELEYVFGTIGSALEFVDYVFLIEGVTRAFTHQLVRHRVGTSFAQQTQRSVNMEGFKYLATGKCKDIPTYHRTMEIIEGAYGFCVEEGANPQDARGLLPTNILTNILFKANLRTLSGIMGTRLCFKTQGEFQEVAKELRDRICKVHPEFEPVLRVQCGQNLTCAFPNFKGCPVRKALPERQGGELDEVMDIWNHTQLELQSKEDKGDV